MQIVMWRNVATVTVVAVLFGYGEHRGDPGSECRKWTRTIARLR